MNRENTTTENVGLVLMIVGTLFPSILHGHLVLSVFAWTYQYFLVEHRMATVNIAAIAITTFGLFLWTGGHEAPSQSTTPAPPPRGKYIEDDDLKKYRTAWAWRDEYARCHGHDLYEMLDIERYRGKEST